MTLGPTLHKYAERGMAIFEKVHPGVSGLKLLAYSLIEVTPGYLSAPLLYPVRETLLICSEGAGNVIVNGKKLPMALYDMVYIPENTPFQLEGGASDIFHLGMSSAPSQAQGEVVYIPFAEVKADPARTRPMANKVVYLNLSEKIKAQNLVAGLVFFEPFTRSFPAHMHTDQEEIYHFLSGNGSIELYPSEEKKFFVYNVEKGAVATVPLEHYHPVFAQETPVVWLWVIAGERYWVGDRDATWMAASKRGE
jgi:mannose-6-phosphate isomerase-like protein (cupin superfamily)